MAKDPKDLGRTDVGKKGGDIGKQGGMPEKKEWEKEKEKEKTGTETPPR